MEEETQLGSIIVSGPTLDENDNDVLTETIFGHNFCNISIMTTNPETGDDVFLQLSYSYIGEQNKHVLEITSIDSECTVMPHYPSQEFDLGLDIPPTDTLNAINKNQINSYKKHLIDDILPNILRGGNK